MTMEIISGITADLNGNITHYGKGAEKIFGYKENEVLGKNVEIFHPEKAKKTVLPRLFKTAMEEGVFEEYITLVRKNGKEFPAHIKVTQIKDKTGKVIGLAGMTRDLSEV
jgi:two-component system, LuxR family, sensor kinase FixL